MRHAAEVVKLAAVAAPQEALGAVRTGGGSERAYTGVRDGQARAPWCGGRTLLLRGRVFAQVDNLRKRVPTRDATGAG